MNGLTKVVRPKPRNMRRETPAPETTSKPAPQASAPAQIVSAPEVAPAPRHA
jgi:hypothetical protein